MSLTAVGAEAVEVSAWRARILQGLAGGARFAGLYGMDAAGGCLLTALLAVPGGFEEVRTLIRPDGAGQLAYASLTPEVKPAFWYERALQDLSGVRPLGHPRPEPLLLPLEEGSEVPRPGHRAHPALLRHAATPGPVDVAGHGMFAVTLGPVRSGVFESVEFLIETPGEDIPHLNIRPHYKHRGVAKRFEQLGVEDGVLVAERVEGISSVAHALAFSHAAESAAGVQVPPRAGLIRLVYAELERIANHLDVAMRLADAAGLAVATSRFAWHKEATMRLVSEMCGSRFGRGVVIPGGVRAEPALAPAQIRERLDLLHARIRADARLAMDTPSFLDRLRGTGVLPSEVASEWAATGPLARASGIAEDTRWERPTDSYGDLAGGTGPALEDGGDVLARLKVRWDEIDTSAALIGRALALLEGAHRHHRLAEPVEIGSGDAYGLGWAESAQGEVLHALSLRDGLIRRCFARTASLHNLVVFHDVFHGDVFTDFPFIEASFGLSYAGVAM